MLMMIMILMTNCDAYDDDCHDSSGEDSSPATAKSLEQIISGIKVQCKLVLWDPNLWVNM